ncbi:MAG: hypothetical protein WAJ94_09385 [Candidatus Cybelea sp.]
MTKSSLLTVALGSGVALLAACSNNGLAGSPSAPSSTTQVQTQSGPAKQATKRGLAELSVADRGLNEVLEFNKTYKPTGTISDSGPDGDWIDAKGNLYVTNFSSGNVTVNEYNKADALIFTYSNGLTEPVDVTTDAKGNVIVANFAGYKHVGTVVVYPQGNNTASVTCNTGLANEGVAVDSKGDVFVTGYSGNSGEIIEYKGGLTSPCSATTLAPTLSNPAGIQVDKKDDLVVCDQHTAVDIIPPPYTSISRTITVSGGSDYLHDALTGDNKLLFIADPNAVVVDVVDYSTGTLVTQLNSSNGLSSPFGVATYPFAK